jgi:hypothetical protein
MAKYDIPAVFFFLFLTIVVGVPLYSENAEGKTQENYLLRAFARQSAIFRRAGRVQATTDFSRQKYRALCGTGSNCFPFKSDRPQFESFLDGALDLFSHKIPRDQ